MPNKRKAGTKLYTVSVDTELQAAIDQLITLEQKRLGKGYTVTRSDVMRKVLEENCHRYLAGGAHNKEGTK